MSGRTEYANTPEGSSRLTDITEVYRKTLPPVTPGEYEFRTVLLRGAGVKPLLLDPFVTALDWSEEGQTDGSASGLTGSIRLQRPDPEDPSSLPIGRAHQVRLDVRVGSKWKDLWTMRVDSPEVDLQGAVSAELADSLDAIKRTKAKFVVRSDEKLFAHEAFALGAKKVKVKIHSLAEGRVRLKAFKTEGTLLDFLVACYAPDREQNGLIVVPRFAGGTLSVYPFTRNAVLYELEPLLREATLTQKASVRPTTVLRGTARIGKGKAAKARHYVYGEPAIIRRYGYVREEKNFGHLKSVESLERRVKLQYAKNLKVTRFASITIPGVPFIRYADAALLDLAEEGYKGEEAFVYVSAIRHSLSPGEYTSSLEVTSADLFKKYQAGRDRLLRAEKARERRRRRK